MHIILLNFHNMNYRDYLRLVKENMFDHIFDTIKNYWKFEQAFISSGFPGGSDGKVSGDSTLEFLPFSPLNSCHLGNDLASKERKCCLRDEGVRSVDSHYWLLFTLPFLSRCLEVFEKRGEDTESNNEEEKEPGTQSLGYQSSKLVTKVEDHNWYKCYTLCKEWWGVREDKREYGRNSDVPSCERLPLHRETNKIRDYKRSSWTGPMEGFIQHLNLKTGRFPH